MHKRLAILLICYTPFAHANELSVHIGNEPQILHASLLLPEQLKTKVPVVLIIAGSGPTDRNGNSKSLAGENNSLKMLAEGLSEAGYATLRFDKRGIGQSAGAGFKEREMRFSHYVQDAASWIAYLKADVRFSKVVVLGHSEGALIGLLAAKAGKADAYISLAGPARPAAAILRTQLEDKLPSELAQQNEIILQKLEQGEETDKIPAALQSLYRPSVQPYLISWFKFNPAAELKQLNLPTLIIQGTTDIQVATNEANALHQAQAHAEIALISGMNHILKLVPADQSLQLASYSDPKLPLAPELIKKLTEFLVKL